MHAKPTLGPGRTSRFRQEDDSYILRRALVLRVSPAWLIRAAVEAWVKKEKKAGR
jgi:hypothetical protein